VTTATAIILSANDNRDHDCKGFVKQQCNRATVTAVMAHTSFANINGGEQFEQQQLPQCGNSQKLQ